MKTVNFAKANGQESAERSPETREQLVERLFNEHNDTLIRFLCVKLNSSEEAKEVAQESYVRLLQLDRPEAVSYFRAFLFKTATNIAIDRLRRRTLDQRHLTLGFFDDSSPSAEKTAVHRDLLQNVNACLQELPPKCRKAFLLSRIYGLSTGEIAEQMQLTRRMIRLYLERATLHCHYRLGGGEGTRHD